MIGGSTFVASEHISGSHGMSHSFLLLWFEFVTLDAWTAKSRDNVYLQSLSSNHARTSQRLLPGAASAGGPPEDPKAQTDSITWGWSSGHQPVRSSTAAKSITMVKQKWSPY